MRERRHGQVKGEHEVPRVLLFQGEEGRLASDPFAGINGIKAISALMVTVSR